MKIEWRILEAEGGRFMIQTEADVQTQVLRTMIRYGRADADFMAIELGILRTEASKALRDLVDMGILEPTPDSLEAYQLRKEGRRTAAASSSTPLTQEGGDREQIWNSILRSIRNLFRPRRR